jgi:alpha,alpha-trehalase
MPKQIHDLGALFEAVQMQNLLGDGKTFPDCVPLRSLKDIEQSYNDQHRQPGFDLKKFVEDNFQLPASYSSDFKSDATQPPEKHIEALWDVLTRQPDDEKGGSLIPLPHPYIVPGGRFREIYYWDSYFTMLGLQVSGRKKMIQHMVDNFSHLINTFGYIPNGNRMYFLGRSQPPFFSLMVKLLSEMKSDALTANLTALEKEYRFWMKGYETLSPSSASVHRVVRMPDGEMLNRYWDDNETPRPEAYKEDVELSHQSSQKPEVLFRHLRAAAESGWDFSSRWFRDGNSFASIHTTEIVPVDLNCLLFHLEKMLADGFKEEGNAIRAAEYLKRSVARKNAIQKYCWNEEKKFFFDFDWAAGRQKESETLAAAFPLFFEIATAEQAMDVESTLREKFLKPGGLTTTLVHSGQQWDAPNGWAPLQWIAYQGLLNYGRESLAAQVKENWMQANQKVFLKTGKMTEKYDVWNEDAAASGGEYPNQDGFGWTNGVYLKMAAY